MEIWQTAQNHERNWWGNCVNTLGEEIKQQAYAGYMQLPRIALDGVPFIIDLHGNKVVDIGGGPVSLLLKSINGTGTVVDPCDYPKWVADRYAENKIDYKKIPAEDFTEGEFDEAWIYNCLQHVQDPEKIIQNARKIAKVIRIFEWIDHPTNEMHPFTLTEGHLNEWLKAKGATADLNRGDLVGRCYYGVFPTSGVE